MVGSALLLNLGKSVAPHALPTASPPSRVAAGPFPLKPPHPYHRQQRSPDVPVHSIGIQFDAPTTSLWQSENICKRVCFYASCPDQCVCLYFFARLHTDE